MARTAREFADVGLYGDCAAALGFNLARQRLGRCYIAGIIDDDGEAVSGQTIRHGGANAARGAGHDRDFTGLLGHHPISPQTPKAPSPLKHCRSFFQALVRPALDYRADYSSSSRMS